MLYFFILRGVYLRICGELIGGRTFFGDVGLGIRLCFWEFRKDSRFFGVG